MFLLNQFEDTSAMFFLYIFFDISHQKSDCPPTESECSEADESESAEDVIKHPDGKVSRLLATQVDVYLQLWFQTGLYSYSNTV